jgi:hypothetical protein
MDDEFEIPIVYKNQQLYFKAKRLILGSYTQKIQVDVYGIEVFFEVDEERNYRAYIDPTNTEAMDKTDKDLLQEIAEAIESVRDRQKKFESDGIKTKFCEVKSKTFT